MLTVNCVREDPRCVCQPWGRILRSWFRLGPAAEPHQVIRTPVLFSTWTLNNFRPRSKFGKRFQHWIPVWPRLLDQTRVSANSQQRVVSVLIDLECQPTNVSLVPFFPLQGDSNLLASIHTPCSLLWTTVERSIYTHVLYRLIYSLRMDKYHYLLLLLR